MWFICNLFSVFTGSPFELKVAGAPDASKVKVTGPGIEHGILATFRSHFICETRGAGAGQLTVRVRGPKGMSQSCHMQNPLNLLE